MTDKRLNALANDMKIPKGTQRRPGDESVGETYWEKQVTCPCKKPWNGRYMISCDICGSWDHGKCFGLKERYNAIYEQLPYRCVRCSPEGRKRTRLRQLTIDRDRERKKSEVKQSTSSTRAVRSRPSESSSCSRTLSQEGAMETIFTPVAQSRQPVSKAKDCPSQAGSGIASIATSPRPCVKPEGTEGNSLPAGGCVELSGGQPSSRAGDDGSFQCPVLTPEQDELSRCFETPISASRPREAISPIAEGPREPEGVREGSDNGVIDSLICSLLTEVDQDESAGKGDSNGCMKDSPVGRKRRVPATNDEFQDATPTGGIPIAEFQEANPATKASVRPVSLLPTPKPLAEQPRRPCLPCPPPTTYSRGHRLERLDSWTHPAQRGQARGSRRGMRSRPYRASRVPYDTRPFHRASRFGPNAGPNRCVWRGRLLIMDSPCLSVAAYIALRDNAIIHKAFSSCEIRFSDSITLGVLTAHLEEAIHSGAPQACAIVYFEPEFANDLHLYRTCAQQLLADHRVPTSKPMDGLVMYILAVGPNTARLSSSLRRLQLQLPAGSNGNVLVGAIVQNQLPSQLRTIGTIQRTPLSHSRDPRLARHRIFNTTAGNITERDVLDKLAHDLMEQVILSQPKDHEVAALIHYRLSLQHICLSEQTKKEIVRVIWLWIRSVDRANVRAQSNTAPLEQSVSRPEPAETGRLQNQTKCQEVNLRRDQSMPGAGVDRPQVEAARPDARYRSTGPPVLNDVSQGTWSSSLDNLTPPNPPIETPLERQLNLWPSGEDNVDVYNNGRDVDMRSNRKT